jgi:hypothetical protein
MGRLTQRGTVVPLDISHPILQAGQAVVAGEVTAEIAQNFYAVRWRLARLLAGGQMEADTDTTFDSALGDAELLLKHAAESGQAVEAGIITPILAAATAIKNNTASDEVRAAFYQAYTRLAVLFGDVTAETIRNCSSVQTKEALAHDRRIAVFLTAGIAVISVYMFVTDTLSNKIVSDMTSGNAAVAAFHLGLISGSGENAARNDAQPCETLNGQQTGNQGAQGAGSQAAGGPGAGGQGSGTPQPVVQRSNENVADIEQFQEFVETGSDLIGRAVKLNFMLFNIECGPFNFCWDRTHNAAMKQRATSEGKDSGGAPQLSRAMLNSPQEVLCQVQIYQNERAFATNVQEDYTAIIGAIGSFGLPILYSWLGAYAYRLRLFADTIRRRTYHPSFSDSARMITAVIAGAISGLINPAKGLALSPLAVAFLVGYGVELFFRVLDTLVNAFGSVPFAGQPPGPAQARQAPVPAAPVPTQAAPVPTQAAPVPTQAAPAPTQAAPVPPDGH